MEQILKTNNFKIILDNQIYKLKELTDTMSRIYNDQGDLNLDVDNLELIYKNNDYLDKIDLNLDKIDKINLESKTYLDKLEKLRLKKYRIDKKIEKIFLPYMLVSRMTLDIDGEEKI
jgi:hypothetical protein